ncbi:MAG: hypothetical protein ABI863_15900 [Ginsengibacter sp.]
MINSLPIDGDSTLRLPNKEELAMLYANRNLVDHFSNALYWSGEQYGNSNAAWQQDFVNGYQNHLPLRDEYHVGSIRDF